MEQKTAVKLTELQRMLLVRAANTEINLLNRLYGEMQPDCVSWTIASGTAWQEQTDALRESIEVLNVW